MLLIPFLLKKDGTWQEWANGGPQQSLDKFLEGASLKALGECLLWLQDKLSPNHTPLSSWHNYVSELMKTTNYGSSGWLLVCGFTLDR